MGREAEEERSVTGRSEMAWHAALSQPDERAASKKPATSCGRSNFIVHGHRRRWRERGGGMERREKREGREEKKRGRKWEKGEGLEGLEGERGDDRTGER